MPLVLAAVSPTKLIIVAVAVLVQYLLSMLAFIKISKAKITMKKFLLWNFLIIFVFYIGPIIALIYSIIKVKKEGSVLDEKINNEILDNKDSKND